MKFAELNPEQKQKLLEEYRDINALDEWWEYIYEDAIKCAEILGICTNGQGISFSGFSIQGDGASFVGGYSNQPDASKKIREYAPEDKVLHSLADRLTAMQMTSLFLWNEHFTASISRSGHYCHSGTVMVEFEPPCEQLEKAKSWLADQTKLTNIMCGFANWIYKQLEKQYDYLTSDDAVTEYLNELEFNENGAII